MLSRLMLSTARVLQLNEDRRTGCVHGFDDRTPRFLLRLGGQTGLPIAALAVRFVDVSGLGLDQPPATSGKGSVVRGHLRCRPAILGRAQTSHRRHDCTVPKRHAFKGERREQPRTRNNGITGHGGAGGSRCHGCKASAITCERELFRNRAVERDPHIPGADSISIGFTCLGMREGTLLP